MAEYHYQLKPFFPLLYFIEWTNEYIFKNFQIFFVLALLFFMVCHISIKFVQKKTVIVPKSVCR